MQNLRFAIVIHDVFTVCFPDDSLTAGTMMRNFLSALPQLSPDKASHMTLHIVRPSSPDSMRHSLALRYRPRDKDDTHSRRQRLSGALISPA